MGQKIKKKMCASFKFYLQKSKRQSEVKQNWKTGCRLNDNVHLGEHFEVAKGKWPRLITNMRRFVFMPKRDGKQIVIKHT